ncbi:Gfo/Idh/MocA family protein [Sphingobacterium humi]|uniref:Gfo/Idh/MocA family oxidoreductase n=1 Tax=Sphingobacterium humi TaxID=1796905 RepID=A0A6N8KVH9_9SPHI|nr:Gfo/Idh/MocA family oxidoreductase [Sphingobacterium humi]MVZ60709.1 gfo/Idh/MocA family oxidoreductase [Sphingobacterium humi]
MNVDNFGFGLIGTGAIAHIHAAAIKAIANAQLIGAYNRTAEKAAFFAQQHDCKSYQSLEELLKDDSIAIVCICTASGAHLEAAEKAIRAGKHCLIEKPLEITVDRCNEIIQLAEEHNVLIGTIFPTRFYPNSLKIKQKLTDGGFGDLVMGSAYIKWHRSAAYYASAAWRGTWAFDGGGALMNQGIHAVDMLLWYMGEAVSVSALSANRVHQNIEVEDTVVASIKFKNGALGSIECTTAAFPGTAKKIEIIGSKGSAILEENSLTLWEFEGDSTDSQVQQAEAAVSGGVSDPMAIGHYGHQLQVEDFLAAIQGKHSPLIDGQEGKKSVALISAIYESAKTGQTVYL